MHRNASRNAALLLSAALTTAALHAPARASSDGAWADFAKDVEKACKAAVQGTYVKPGSSSIPMAARPMGSPSSPAS